jgi:hypothetical protein
MRALFAVLLVGCTHPNQCQVGDVTYAPGASIAPCYGGGGGGSCFCNTNGEVQCTASGGLVPYYCEDMHVVPGTDMELVDGGESDMAGRACGPTLRCKDTELCVGKAPVGPATVYSCVAIPAGCGATANCACAAAAACTTPFLTCGDVKADEILCVCDGCQ